LFFSGISGTVVVVGVQRLFALQGMKGSKPPQERGWLCAKVRLTCKKCDRKKQQKGRCGESSKKTSEALRYEGRGFLLPEAVVKSLRNSLQTDSQKLRALKQNKSPLNF
jgi:hypothetical protein